MTPTNAPAGTPPMADDLTGTNTEKIDKLVSAVVEIKTTIRVTAWMVGFTLPFLVALLGFLVVRSYETSAKLDRMDERLGRIERLLEHGNRPPP